MLLLIIIFTSIGSIFSLIGGLFLLSHKNFSKSLNLKLTSFAAGVLLATAFLDLFPEALERAGGGNVFIPALAGMVGFFLLERFLWFHHHHEAHSDARPSAYLVIVGDTTHNFIDGIVIAAAFLTSVPLGITTAVAVAAHEVPQEIADFSILLSQGFSKRKVLYINLLSSLFALVGAVITYFVAVSIEQYLPTIIAFTAGMFVYIASSDLIPELHRSGEKYQTISQVVAFLFGIILVGIISTTIGV